MQPSTSTSTSTSTQPHSHSQPHNVNSRFIHRNQQQSIHQNGILPPITQTPIDQYTSSHLSSSLLSLLSCHGFHKTSSRAHSLLNELFVRYLHLIAKDALSNANHSSRSIPNSKDVEAALSNLGTETQDLIRWCRNTRESDNPIEQSRRDLLRERAAELRPLISHGLPPTSPIPFHYQTIPEEDYHRLDLIRRKEEAQISSLSSTEQSLVKIDQDEEGSEKTEQSDAMEVDQEEEEAEEGEEEEDQETISRREKKGKAREIIPDEAPPPYTSSHFATSTSHSRARRFHSNSSSSSDASSSTSPPTYKRRRIVRDHSTHPDEGDEEDSIDYVPSFLPAFPVLPTQIHKELLREKDPNRMDLDPISNSDPVPPKDSEGNEIGGLSADLEYLNFLKQEEEARIRAVERAREKEREERMRKEEEIRIMHAGGDAAAMQNDSRRSQVPSTQTRPSSPPPPPPPPANQEQDSSPANETSAGKDELAIWKNSTPYASSMLSEVQSEAEIPSLSEQLKVEEREVEKELEKEKKRALLAQSKRGSITASGSNLTLSQRADSEREHTSSLFAFATDYPALVSETLSLPPTLLTPLTGSNQQIQAFSQRRRLALTISDPSRYSPSDTLYSSIPVSPSSTPFNPGPSLMITLPPPPEKQEYTMNAAGEMVPTAPAPPEFTPTLPNGRIVSLFPSSGSIHPTLGYRHSNQTLNSARTVASHNLLKLISRSKDPEPLYDDSHAERVFQGRGARSEWLDPIGQKFTLPQASGLGEEGSSNPNGLGIGGTKEDTNKCGPSNSFLAPALNSLHLKRIEEIKKKIKSGSLKLDEEESGLLFNQIPAPERPNNATLVHTWDWNQRDFTDPNLPTVANFKKVRKEEMKGREVGFVEKGKEKEKEVEFGSGLLSNDNHDKNSNVNGRGGSVGTAGSRSRSQTPASRSSPVNAPSPLVNQNLNSAALRSTSSPKESPKGTQMTLPQEPTVDSSSSSFSFTSSAPLPEVAVTDNQPKNTAPTEQTPVASTSQLGNLDVTTDAEGAGAGQVGSEVEGGARGEALGDANQQS